MARDTGFPAADAQSDFLRARRERSLSALARRLRREPGDVNVILPFEEVVEALGRTGERSLGLKVVALDHIVGTVDRTRDFDRRFRPTSGRVRSRWERIAQAMRRGESIPPILLYKIGDLYFVRDGHHRVSVARALGWRVMDAMVTEVRTRVGADRELRMSDLPMKSHERLFRERVPLPEERAERIVLSVPQDYGSLAEGVEAWGFRQMQELGDLLDRSRVAEAWFDNEFAPVVELLRGAGLMDGGGTEGDAYHRLACRRYELTRSHEWSDEVIAALQADRAH
jgi:hypothetical protein